MLVWELGAVGVEKAPGAFPHDTPIQSVCVTYTKLTFHPTPPLPSTALHSKMQSQITQLLLLTAALAAVATAFVVPTPLVQRHPQVRLDG